MAYVRLNICENEDAPIISYLFEGMASDVDRVISLCKSDNLVKLKMALSKGRKFEITVFFLFSDSRVLDP